VQGDIVEATLFGRYRLVELLGRSGIAEVWRACDTQTDRVVALKVLPANFADDQGFQQRFRSEVGAAAGLDEPHVVPIHDFGEIEGRLFVAMRLINGRDLQSLLDEGPLPPARAVGIIEQIASALHAGHAVGLVHGDVKPSNILVAANDFSYLIDFGFAHAAGETGTFDAGAEICALTCVLYQLLTGQLPFPGVGLKQFAVAHRMRPPPLPSAVESGIPEKLDNVVATGMAKDPRNRYATTVELASAAREAITAPVTAPTVRDEESTRSARDDFASAPAQHGPPAPPASRHPSSPKRQPAKARWWRRHAVAIAAGVLVTVLVAAAAVTIALPAEQSRPSTRQQSTMPFIGITPHGLVVDSNGTVYITDYRSQRVLSLAAGSTSQTVLPFTGLEIPDGVAVQRNGTIYVTDHGNHEVIALAAGATSQTVLPFTGLSNPSGVAVDSNGTVYVSDDGNNRVLSLAAGSTSSQTVLPFTGLRNQFGVAVAGNGTVYVADDGNNRVVSLAAGSTSQTVLPFTGLSDPADVVVDTNGTVYVADYGNKRVVWLPAEST
jgi:serine/threonine protein kinase, bacterial